MDQPKQTTPKGAEIPVPTRGQVFDDLVKGMRPVDEKPKKRKASKRKRR